MNASALPFTPGEVIQTLPQAGFWGCAVVLTAKPRSSEFHPQFHVAITPIVFRHEFTSAELDLATLSVLRFGRHVRIGKGEYVARGEVPCIGIYTAVTRGDVKSLGKVDPHGLYESPLTFDVGDGTKGAFPLCGPLHSSIGSEAVVAWRRVHDAAALEKDILDARERYETFEQQRLEKTRDDRRRKRGSK